MLDHVLIRPSDNFLKIVRELSSQSSILPSLDDKLSTISDDSELTLTGQEVRWCHERMRELGMKARIHELLKESQVILPSYQPPPRNPELQKRIEKLKAEQENLEYKNMTRSVDASGYNKVGIGEIGKEMRSLNKQLVTGMQYLLSIVGTFFGVFLGLGMAMDDYGIRALAGVIGALIVGIAELYFLIRDDLREEEQYKDE